jgi:hypothetical protein
MLSHKHVITCFLLHLSNIFKCFSIFQNLPPLDIADLDNYINNNLEHNDDASEMLAYEAVLELDTILELM